MAYDESKLTKLEHLKMLAQKVNEADVALGGRITTVNNRIDELVAEGGEPNVITGVKVNGVALAVVDKVVDILIAQGTANDTISVNGADVAVKGLAALRAQVEELVGDGNGSVEEIVNAAINEFATKISDDGTVNTFKELVDYVATHAPEAATMAADIATAKTGIAANKADIDAAKAKLADIADGATKVEASETNGNIKINGAETVVYDETALAGRVTVIEGKPAMAITADDITAWNAKLSANDIATNADVTAMLNEVFGVQA